MIASFPSDLSGPSCPDPFGIAEGSGDDSAEAPRRSERRRAEAGRRGNRIASRVVRGFARTRRRAARRRYNRPLFAIAKDKAPGPRVVCEPARKRSRAAHRATQGRSGRRPGVRAYRARQGELRERERARVPPWGAGEWQAERPLQGRRPWHFALCLATREDASGLRHPDARISLRRDRSSSPALRDPRCGAIRLAAWLWRMRPPCARSSHSPPSAQRS